MNQSELEANACNRRRAREKAREQVVIGFVFTSDWLRKWRELSSFNQSQIVAKQNQSQRDFFPSMPVPLTEKSTLSSTHQAE